MSKANDIKVKELKPVFTPEQIAARIQELAAEINAEYGDEPMVAVCVLKGGLCFLVIWFDFCITKIWNWILSVCPVMAKGLPAPSM